MTDFSTIPDLYDATIQELLNGLDAGQFTVVQLVSVSEVGGCIDYFLTLSGLYRPHWGGESSRASTEGDTRDQCICDSASRILRSAEKIFGD
jgi:hypothetical protein